MESNMKDMLMLLRGQFVHDEKAVPDLHNKDWYQVLRNLKKDKLECVLYDFVKNTKWEAGPNEEVSQIWQHIVIRNSLYQSGLHHEVKRIVLEAQKRNIPFKIFKGIVLAELYPKKQYRHSLDTDILVEPEDFDRMSTCLLDLGYERRKQKESVYEFMYTFNAITHKIELHTCLWEDFEGIKIDYLRQLSLKANEKIYYTLIDGVQIPTFEPTQHLIYMIFHFVKHYVYEGISMRSVLDIVLFSNYYAEEIDFSYLFQVLKNMRYDFLLSCIYEVGAQWMGLAEQVKDTYFKQTKTTPNQEKIEIFLENITRHEKETDGRWDTTFLVLPYFGNDHVVNDVNVLRKEMKKKMKETIYKRTLRLLLLGYSDDFYGDCHYELEFSEDKPIVRKDRWKVACQFYNTSFEKMSGRIDKAILSIEMMKQLKLVA